MAARRRQLGGVDRLPSGRYRVRLTDPATGARVSAGTFTNKADAEKAFASAVTAQDRGTWVAPRTTLTLADYSDQWLESRLTSKGSRLRPRVRELYEGQLRRHILPTLGRAPLAKLRPTTVRSWYSALVDHGPGAITAAKCYRLLRAILNTAVEDGLLAVNPCTIRGAGAERSPERIIPTVGQVVELADAVDPRYRALVLLAAYGGLRRGELFGLRRRHVDLIRGLVTVEAQRQQLAHGELIVGPPKSEAGRRTVALPPQAIVALQSHLDRWTGPAADDWVFTGAKGGPLRDAVWQHQWDVARRSVGLPDLHFHDLRHVSATLTAGTGAGVKEIMHRLGHSSAQAALRYQHATPERDRSIAEAISRLIDAANTTHSDYLPERPS
jgi:integrase